MRVRLGFPAFGAVAGLAVGLVDAAILPMALRTRGTPLLPPHAQLAVVWTWVTVLAAIAVVFSAPRLHRAGIVVMLVAGPGLILLSRGAEPLKTFAHVPTALIVLVWLALMITGAFALRRLEFAPTRRFGWWAAAVLISSALVILGAADVRLNDWLPRRRIANNGNRNVVLVFLDTTRADDAATMPMLSRFAQDAITFDDAWAPAPWTVPSHFAVFTGVDPWRVPFDPESRRFTADMPMLAQRFRARHYATAAIMANPTVTPEAGFGAGFDEFTASRGSGVCRSAIGDLLSRLWLHSLPRSPVCGWFVATEVTSRAVRFMRRADRPFFLTLNYMDAHDPYYVPPECHPPGFSDLRHSERSAFARGPRTPALLGRVHEQYRVAMRCMDRSLGELFEALQRDPDYATTTVIVVGDHGEQFGEFGKVSHGNSVFPPVLRVPLIVRAAGQSATHVATPVSTTDINATLLGILGTPGKPLALLDPSRRRDVVSFYAAQHGRTESAFSAVAGDCQLIRDQDGRDTLFGSCPPPVVARASEAISRAKASQRGNAEFRSIGYLQ